MSKKSAAKTRLSSSVNPKLLSHYKAATQTPPIKDLVLELSQTMVHANIARADGDELVALGATVGFMYGCLDIAATEASCPHDRDNKIAMLRTLMHSDLHTIGQPHIRSLLSAVIMVETARAAADSPTATRH